MALATAQAVQVEERAAREQLRRFQKMQRGAAVARERAEKSVMATTIADTRRVFPRCKCDLHRGMTRADLASLGSGCTDPHYCCPRLDAVRRRVGT